MRSVRIAHSYKKDFRKEARTENVEAIMSVLPIIITSLAADAPLDVSHKDHPLSGEWHDCRECHVKDNFLLVYLKEGNNLHLLRLGSHSEIFGL
jgi:mRNA interferase YafQ